MAAFRQIAVALVLSVWTPGMLAQQAGDKPQAESDFGLVIEITPDAILNFLDTVADDMAADYELDDEQYYRVNEILHERIPAFLRENNRELSQLAREFTSAWTSPEPPDSVFVAQWAERARPLLEKFHGTVEVLADDMRDVMKPEQIAKLDGYLAAMEVGSQFVDHRLETWSQGGFDPESDWHRSPIFKEAESTRRQEMERRMVEARREVIAYHTGQPWADVLPGAGMPGEPLAGEPEAGAPGPMGDTPAGGPGARRRIVDADAPGAEGAAADPAGPAGKPGARAAAAPRDKWEVYTEEFIARYKLDDAQAQKARLFYRRAAEDRDRYERRNLKQLDEIAKALAAAQTAEQREPALKQRAEFESGLERMFERLKGKLDSIPTRTQRKAAEVAGAGRAE